MPPPQPKRSVWSWLARLLAPKPQAPRKLPAGMPPSDAERRVLDEFCRQFQITFQRPELLRLALTHRSYLSVTGQSARESNERLEFLGDSVLGLVTSEFLYREHPNEHEGQLTKTKSLLVSKAILSRRALAMGLGKFVLMSRSESDSGGRQRLSILADAFESVIGAIYLDQGFESARSFIMRWLLRESREIVADKRHTNYKSHLQEYVQSTYRTHPVYRIRSEMGPDHSKQFNVEVLVGRRVLGTGRGRNKKDAEQAAARNALEQSEGRSRGDDMVRRPPRPATREAAAAPRAASPGHPTREPSAPVGAGAGSPASTSHDREGRRRGRRGGRGRGGRSGEPAPTEPASPPGREETGARPITPPPADRAIPMGEPSPGYRPEDELEEIGRPEGLQEERRIDPYAWDPGAPHAGEAGGGSRGAERGVGGRSVERFAGRGWTDEPSRDAPAQPAADEAEAPSGERSPEEADTGSQSSPREPNGGREPDRGAAYGRRRSRR